LKRFLDQILVTNLWLGFGQWTLFNIWNSILVINGTMEGLMCWFLQTPR